METIKMISATLLPLIIVGYFIYLFIKRLYMEALIFAFVVLIFYSIFLLSTGHYAGAIFFVILGCIFYIIYSFANKVDTNQSNNTEQVPVNGTVTRTISQRATYFGSGVISFVKDFIAINGAIKFAFCFICSVGVILIIVYVSKKVLPDIAGDTVTVYVETQDAVEKAKKEHDQKTGNGNYIPTHISADIDITAEKKVLWCKPGFKTGPIQLESSGSETFFFDVDEIRLNPVGTKTILVMDKLKPTCTFGKGNYYIFIPKNILADTSETDAGIFIEIKKAITAK